MILRFKKDEIDFQFIGAEVLANCPSLTSNDFTEGYLEFVREFFEDLECSQFVFHFEYGFYDIDLSIVIEGTLKMLSFKLDKLPVCNKQEFWLGIDVAFTESLKALKLVSIATSNITAA